MLEENTIEHLNYSLLAQDFDPLFELLDSLPQNVPVFISGSSSKGHFWQNQHVVSWSRGDR